MIMNPGASEADLQKALATLKDGGIIAYPTDTIWGLGCDSTDCEAVKKLFRIKNRPSSKAMISLVGSIDELRDRVGDIPKDIVKEIENSERPITVIFPHPKGICDMLTAEDGSAAFRVVMSEFTARLCSLLGKPLVSTSANISGGNSPKTFDEIRPELLKKVDYICETGRDFPAGQPSRIIKLEADGTTTLIRE